MQNACVPVSADSCSQAQIDVGAVVQALASEIKSRGVTARYPHTMSDVDKIQAAAAGYASGDCLGNPSADVDGSPCFSDSATVLLGPATLMNDLSLDELAALSSK